MGDLEKKLEALWEKFLPATTERVSAIAEAAEELQAGMLREETRAVAESAAHKIAGSAGTFGFIKITDIARDLEEQLGEGAAIDPQRFAETVGRLEKELDRSSVKKLES
jgi:HPt (histidine-containing phosphotransfer) domain-containing protein